MSQNVFFLDTETTSQDQSKARVVQMAIVAKSLVNTESQYYRCEWNVKPPGEIEIGAIATHHITPKMVQNAPSFEKCEGSEVLKRRLHLGHILVAHNAPYDVQVLANEGVVVDTYIDTLRVARHLLDDPNIESYSLQYLRYFYNLDDLHVGELSSGFAHSALYDTIVLKWLYEFLYEKLKKLHPGVDTIVRMLELTRSPVLLKRFSFGKHRGKTYEQVRKEAPDYLDWLKREEMKKDLHERNQDMLHTLIYWLNQ